MVSLAERHLARGRSCRFRVSMCGRAEAVKRCRSRRADKRRLGGEGVGGRADRQRHVAPAHEF
eukprot:3454396-Prymnesium_polylepis.3